MTNPETSVRHHYGRTGVLDRIITALKETGIDPERLNYQDLFPFDRLHSRGIAATREHAERAGIRPGMQVLDLGCGIGGASRYLAVACGCRVTAIDLTEEFVEVAQALTARCVLWPTASSFAGLTPSRCHSRTGVSIMSGASTSP